MIRQGFSKVYGRMPKLEPKPRPVPNLPKPDNSARWCVAGEHYTHALFFDGNRPSCDEHYRSRRDLARQDRSTAAPASFSFAQNVQDTVLVGSSDDQSEDQQ